MSSLDPNDSHPIFLSAHIEEVSDADDVVSHSASAERSRNCSSSSSMTPSELAQRLANPDHEPIPSAVGPGLNDGDNVEQTGRNTPTFLEPRLGADRLAKLDPLYESLQASSSPPAAGNTTTLANHAQERLSPLPSLPSPAAIPGDVGGSHLSREHASNDTAAPILYDTTPTPLPAAGPGDTGGSHTSGAPDVHKPGPSAPNPQPTLIAGQTTRPNQLTGWPAVEKALTEFDRQEIGAYKEDIDSLLTFTGLYSAVLTAFVIVSYPQLQEDTAGETLQVLRLIAAQTATYSITGGQLVNSTATAPSTSPPFQPSAAAIRINALWFASLVISLAVASISIFVKQWLRAYMSFASASPQGQLRIRHFRRSGIEAWRVFEIASTLPLLLQISLALFFVGLCIFTFDVHPVIGKTTLPLVCAWAFLLAVIIMSPIFSSRCPYKTPALSAATTFLRTHIFPGIAIIILKHIPSSIVYMLSILSSHFSAIVEQLDEWAPLGTWVEEESVLNDKQWDLAILASADALQADDTLLGTTMTEALSQSNPNWDSVTEFLIRVIGNRVPLTGSDDPRRFPATAIQHYGLLSDAARTAIHTLCTDHILAGLSKPTPDLSKDSDLQRMADWSMNIFAVVYDYRHPLIVDTSSLEGMEWNLATLSSVDGVLVNDMVLAAAVAGILKQSDQELVWVDIVGFLVRAIDKRMALAAGDNLREHRRTAAAWCGSLSEAARTAIGDLFRVHVIQGLAKSTIQSENTVGDKTTVTQSWRIFAGIYDLGMQCTLLGNILRLDNGQLDLEKLGLIDALLVDDDFFATAMTELLKERSLDPASVTEFLVRAISNRIHFDDPRKRHMHFEFIHWEPKQCYLLSSVARSAIIELFGFHVMALVRPLKTSKILDRPMVEWLQDMFVGLLCGSSAFGAQTISAPHAFFDRWRQELAREFELLGQSRYPPVAYSELDLILSMRLIQVLVWTETEPNQEYYQWEVVNETLHTIGSHEGSLRYKNLGIPALLEKVSLGILHRLRLEEIDYSTPYFDLSGMVLAIKLHMSAATSGLDIQDKENWGVAFKHAMKNITRPEDWEILEKKPLEHGRESGQEHWIIQQALELLVQCITENLKLALRVLDLVALRLSGAHVSACRVNALSFSWLAITLVEDHGFYKATNANSGSENSSNYSELRSVLKLAAGALFQTTAKFRDPQTNESGTLTRICQSMPPCTNGENHSRIACLGGSVIPHYFYLSLWSAAVSLQVPIDHSRLLCIENMTEEERDAIRTQGEEDFEELRQERWYH